MRSICIPHTELPGTSQLFADYLYRYERAAQFYRHNPHDPDAVRAAAEAARIPAERRQRLVAALRKINGDSPSLDRLAAPDTVVIVTGQQVGLFGGPAYTIYKALTAARLAKSLTESGISAVPVFWLATEDHDFAEIDHVWAFGVDGRPRKLKSNGRAPAATPVGGIPIAEAPVEELRAALRGLPFADDVASIVAEAYAPGATYGGAFRRLLASFLDRYDVVFIDPMNPDIREIAAPLLKIALERAPDLTDAIRRRGDELREAGYHAQVLVEPNSSLFFKLENGRRLSLKREGTAYLHDSRKFTVEELAARPAELSPNALLRPIMQDYLMPTAAYIGGPAELAYLAQSRVIYDELLGRMPVAVPRSGFTLIDEKSASLMDKFDLTLRDCFEGEGGLQQILAARLIPPAISMEFTGTIGDVSGRIDRLHAQVAAFDPTLGSALEKSKAKILYQLNKNRRKAEKESLRRQERVQAGAARLSNLVFPEKHLQERLYSFLPFLAQHGFDLLDTIYENVQRGCPDHLLLTV